MAEVIESIGAGQDFTTCTLWEADLVNKNSGDDIIGEMINQVFDESFTMNDSTPLSVKLSVESTARHDGTEGTGARFVRTASGSLGVSTPNGFFYVVEWFEWDHNGENGPAIAGNGASAADVSSLRRLIIHGPSGGNSHRGLIHANTRDIQVMNCIGYDIVDSSNSDIWGISVDGDRAAGGVFNNTIFGLENTGNGDVGAINLATNSANGICKNNISAGHITGAGAPNCFTFSGTLPDSLNNLSDDATADDAGGSGHVIDATTIDFVSTVGGSEDLHLNSESSEAHAAGVDLVLTPDEVEIDIDGTDRDADGGAWDIGAHQLIVAAGGSVWPSPTKQMAHLLLR